MASPAARSPPLLQPEQLAGRSYRFAPAPRSASTGAGTSTRRLPDVEAGASRLRNAVPMSGAGAGHSAFSLAPDSSAFRRAHSPNALGASYTAEDSFIRQQSSQLAGMPFEDDDDADDYLAEYTASHISHSSHASAPAATGDRSSSLSLRLVHQAEQRLPAGSAEGILHSEPQAHGNGPAPRSQSAAPAPAHAHAHAHARTPSYGATSDVGNHTRRRSKSAFDPRLAARISTSRIATLHAGPSGSSGISHALGTGALAQAQEQLEAASSGFQQSAAEELAPFEPLGNFQPNANRQRRATRAGQSHERSALLPAHSEESPTRTSEGEVSTDPVWLYSARSKVDEALSSACKLTWHDIRHAAAEPVHLLPAVLLGVLMNVLDGVSYGMITFPTSYPLFSSFGGDGVSMFFITCIVSQIAFSAGGSKFGGGNGSMMIEVIPFYSIMSKTIMKEVGNDDAAVISTVIVAFALSSAFIGVAFLLLGWLHTSKLLQFIPRHLLVGAIGGVGVFLIVTGFEVAGQLKDEDGFQWTLATLRFFFRSGHAVALWAIPLSLAVILRLITCKFDGPLIFPIYFFSIPVVFYFVTTALFGLSINDLRAAQWVFDIGAAADAPFYRFYKFIDFRNINLRALAATLPTQGALTFFGILHVPLNIPALAISTGEDNIDTDRELIGHGISNLAAGALFSPPNYITYVNSLLFYRVGGGSRLSGFMLAGATFIVLLAGPSMIGYLPIMVVAALIFVLGIDLVKEALWDTIGRVSRSEYLTILIIMLVMTLRDFVDGLVVGIILACCFFVVQNSQRSTVRAVFDGSIARSTVRRHMTQRRFLDVVGIQTQILKLQGFLFFGTINGVEQLIRRALDIAAWNENPIRFLIVDFSLVTGVDFSAAEAFTRIQRLLETKDVVLIFCGMAPDSEVGVALQSVGMWAEQDCRVEVFANLNSALEWTENEYLLRLYQAGFVARGAAGPASIGHSILSAPLPAAQPIPSNTRKSESVDDTLATSPRNRLLHEAARTAIQHHSHGPTLSDPKVEMRSGSIERRASQSCGPASKGTEGAYQLLLTTFRGYADATLPASFFSTIAPYFVRVSLRAGTQLWVPDDEPDGLYVIERGVLKAIFSFAQEGFQMEENMMPGTVAGEMTFLSHQPRNATVTAAEDSILWRLDGPALARMAERHSDTVRQQLFEILLRVSADEQQALMGYLVSRLT